MTVFKTTRRAAPVIALLAAGCSTGPRARWESNSPVSRQSARNAGTVVSLQDVARRDAGGLASAGDVDESPPQVGTSRTGRTSHSAQAQIEEFIKRIEEAEKTAKQNRAKRESTTRQADAGGTSPAAPIRSNDQGEPVTGRRAVVEASNTIPNPPPPDANAKPNPAPGETALAMTGVAKDASAAESAEDRAPSAGSKRTHAADSQSLRRPSPKMADAAQSATQLDESSQIAQASDAGTESEAKPVPPPRVVRVWSSESPPEADPASASLTVRDAALANRPTGGASADQNGLIERLTQSVRDNPGDVDARARLELLRLALELPEASGDAFPELADPASDWLQHLARVVKATRRALADPIEDVGGALDAATGLERSLRKHADLTVSDVALCSRVRAFGVYDPLPTATFVPYAQNQAIVYYTVQNFTSEETDDNRFRTLLSGEFEVLTPDGEIVWQHAEPMIEDVCRQRRTDFFVAQRIVINAPLREGTYVLKITVEDQLASKRTQVLHEFAVGTARTSSAQR